MTRVLQFCGAFDGLVTVRKGETDSEALDRVGQAMQAAMDKHCRRYGFIHRHGPSIGVDCDATVWPPQENGASANAIPAR